MNILAKWLISAIAILAAAYLLPGIHIAGFLAAFVVALVLGILNAVVKPILFLFTLPITILTLGLFSLILNAIIIVIASYLVHGFVVDNFLWAVLFGIVLSLITALLNKVFQ